MTTKQEWFEAPTPIAGFIQVLLDFIVSIYGMRTAPIFHSSIPNDYRVAAYNKKVAVPHAYNRLYFKARYLNGLNVQARARRCINEAR